MKICKERQPKALKKRERDEHWRDIIWQSARTLLRRDEIERETVIRRERASGMLKLGRALCPHRYPADRALSPHFARQRGR